MTWRVPRIWEDGEVWIIGGGPSVTTQFGIPDEVVRSVVNGKSPSVYSPYMSSIHDKHVIGINVAYLIGDWIDMMFFGDGTFLLNYRDRLAKFPGIKISCHPSVTRYDWIKYLERDTGHVKGISSDPGSVSWNGNSGAAAISIAANTGAKRIILLGFDMKLDKEKNKHWHDIYHQREGLLNPNKRQVLPFARHLIGFPEIAKDAKRRGIEIINACPDSAIDCFKKVAVKDLIDVQVKELV